MPDQEVSAEDVADQSPQTPFWTRPFLTCALGWCAFDQKSDDRGVWGECAKGCGARCGFVSRASLRAYADRELAASSKGER